MSILDFFGKEASIRRKREGCAKKLTNMYYQKIDRMAAAETAAHMIREGDSESIMVLASRFEHVSPSPTGDEEEKEYVVHQLVGLGDRVVPTLEAFCLKTTKPIYWHLRVLDELWSAERMSGFVGKVLEATDNDYWRDPEKKIQLVHLAGDYPGPGIGPNLLKFLEDHNETVRFNAVDSIFRVGYEDGVPVLSQRLVDEESLRIVAHIGRGFADRGWKVSGVELSIVARRLPRELRLDADGSFRALAG